METYDDCLYIRFALRQSSTTKLTAVFEQVDESYIGFIEELPGANTQGATLEETCENL